jgi:16S rRNA (uracil1498-N3)-methyltransferase
MQVHALPIEAIHGESIFLKGQEARHIVKVMRHRPGDQVVFSDGTGHFIHAILDRCEPSELHAVIERREADPRELGAPRATLALALLKGDHFELALEKCVELGVHCFQPLMARHSVVKWKGGDKKLLRWQRIAESAMKQSGRSWLPELREPKSVTDFLAGFPRGERLILAEEAKAGPPPFEREVGSEPYTACVGPEGAFSQEEKRAFELAGAELVSLSPFTLRSETAAVAVIAGLESTRLKRG